MKVLIFKNRHFIFKYKKYIFISHVQVGDDCIATNQIQAFKEIKLYFLKYKLVKNVAAFQCIIKKCEINMKNINFEAHEYIVFKCEII